MAQAQLTEEIIFTKTQKEVLYGALLGDGSLVKHKNGINAQFVYLSKSRQHVDFVAEYFKEYWSGEGIQDTSYIDSRTDKEYFRSQMRTYTNSGFTKEYYHWYVDGKKHLPEDLILTPLTCLIWYIGDGGICHGSRTESIKLSTQCFSKEEQEKILIPQLKNFEATLMKADLNKEGEQQYFIYIPHRKEKEFLSYIGNCPFSDYQYKWEVAEYINAIPQNHTDKEKIFCELYLQGKTYYTIAKEYNVNPNVVKHYLIKNNIYNAPNKKLKNTIVQIKDNEYINIYQSLTEAGKQLGLSTSMLSCIKNGIRKMKDNSTFKAYKDLSKEEQNIVKEKFNNYFQKGVKLNAN